LSPSPLFSYFSLSPLLSHIYVCVLYTAHVFLSCLLLLFTSPSLSLPPSSNLSINRCSPADRDALRRALQVRGYLMWISVGAPRLEAPALPRERKNRAKG
jgi:hypothetical protein